LEEKQNNISIIILENYARIMSLAIK